MTATRQTPATSRARSLAAKLLLSLVVSLVGAAGTLATADVASAATPNAAPSNPTTPCTWNWNRWSQPGAFTFPYDNNSFDPTQAIFSQVSTALGANGWYEASSPPQFRYNGLAQGGGPAEETTGAQDAEWTYGVGYYIMEPGTRQSISISDGSRQESHAFAFYDSAGNQFDRYPRISAVRNGNHYIASESEEKSNPSLSGGISRGDSWSQSVSITVPSDGIVYIHYLNFDERIRTSFASVSGACGPLSTNDSSSDNIPNARVSINVTANDSNVDSRTVKIVGADATGGLTVPGQGRWSVSGGSITFAPATGFVGNPGSIRYTVGDGRGKTTRPASVSISYQSIFTNPDESLGNIAGEPVTLAVTSNDQNIDRRSVSIIGGGTNGSLVEPERGTWTASNGEITFTPLPGVLLDPRPIRYSVRDVGGNVLSPVGVEVSYSPLLEADESLENKAGIIVNINVLENDPSLDLDPTTVRIVGADASGDFEVRDEGIWTVDERTNEVRFIPEAQFLSDPTPQLYTVSDLDGNAAVPVEIVIDYLPDVRDDESLGHPAGAIITIDVLDNDPSNDLDPTTVVIDDPSYDAATRTLRVPGQGLWSVDAATGAITSVPQDGYRDEPTPIRYLVSDDEGSEAASAELRIGYLPIPATVSDSSLDNVIGEAVTLDVMGNDSSRIELDPASVRIIGADSDGVLEIQGEGEWSVDEETGSITFNPIARFEDNPSSVEYIVADMLGVEADPAQVSVSYFGVIPENLAFFEKSDINWFVTGLWGSAAMLLVLLLVALSRQPKSGNAGLRTGHA